MFYKAEESSWIISEEEYAPDRARYYETIFTLANGYLGVRGSSEEGAKQEHPGSYIAGVFNRSDDEPPELPNIPRWLGVKVTADGREISPQKGRLLSYRRYMDMKRAALVREFRVRQNGRITSVRVERFVSRSDPHTAGVRYVVTPENYSARFRFESSLDADVSNSGRKHFKVIRATQFGPDSELRGVLLEVETLESKIKIAEAATVKVTTGGDPIRASRDLLACPHSIGEAITFDAERGREYALEKLVNFFTTRDGFADPGEVAIHCALRSYERGYTSLRVAHERDWAEVWRRSDIAIEGDEAAQRAIRFSLFHSIACAPITSDKVSLAAKGLHGEGYRGHVFWDCEIFNVPMFTYTLPEVARNLLIYRYHTLPGARLKAKAQGYRGAMYAWESADTGEETTPKWVTHYGQNIRVWCGDIEQHISADIAYAVWQYYQATRDEEFLLNYGAEIIFETARFWVSRFEYNDVEDRYEIRGVIGPDEYHEQVNNSVFTNAMAQWNIRLALDLAEDLKHRCPDEWVALKYKLQLSDHRMRVWRRVAENVYLPFSKDLGIHEQFDGFLALERVDIKKFEPRAVPVDVMLGRERTAASQVIKQADVVMLMFLLADQFDARVARANFEYYEPICGHGSSLSPAAHSIVASRLGLCDEALRYFRQSAGIDLGDSMSNSDAGIHMASLGGNWQSVVLGFCGVTAGEQALAFAPRLPASWRSVSFPLMYRGTPLRATVTPDRVVIDLSEAEAGRNLPVCVNGIPGLIEAGRVHTIPLDASGGVNRPAHMPAEEPAIA